MPALAIEICDAGFRAATCGEADPRLLTFTDKSGSSDWPGFAYHDGQKVVFGRAAEDFWFVQPRRVTHSFWDRLAHEPTTLNVPGKPPSFSELAFHFLRQFQQALSSSTGPAEKVVLAVPGSYLKDSATEEEKIGLILGMANELKLPLAAVVDMATAALCDPSADGFNLSLPVVVVDVHLQGSDLTLFHTEEKLERQAFQHLHNSGYSQLLKQLTATMGNRFLRQSAFDILEDGRIEQIFYRQTRDFLLLGQPEFRFQINTTKRNYEMLAKREQLVADAQPFVATLVQGLQNFARSASVPADACTVVLTHRAASVPGLEAKVREAGFRRRLRLPDGAAACGAAVMARRFQVPAEIADVTVETSAPLSEVRRSVDAQWETRLLKARLAEARPAPTHAILEGIGYKLGKQGRFLIGAANANSDLMLPESFSATDCAVPLWRDNGNLWLIDNQAPGGSEPVEIAPRTAVEAGDRLTIRSGANTTEILFVHCPDAVNGSHS